MSALKAITTAFDAYFPVEISSLEEQLRGGADFNVDGCRVDVSALGGGSSLGDVSSVRDVKPVHDVSPFRDDSPLRDVRSHRTKFSRCLRKMRGKAE